jgi:hypothetical protein
MYHYKYTLEAPYSYPSDFFDYFLFVSKRGFCHHFAGSMVIMCRCLGLPARLAAGYLRGDEDKTDSDLFTVREKDAHVWPEVYFKGAGWTAFEPTPPAPDETTAFQKAWKQIADSSQKATTTGYALLQRYWLSLVLLAVALTFAAVAWQQQSRSRYLRAYRGGDAEARVVRAYLRMRRLLADRGALDDKSVSPREFLATLPPELSHLRQEAAALMENYLQARFSRTPASAAQVAAAEQTLLNLRRNLKHPPDSNLQHE